jgi:hypothetical protein
MEMDQTNGKTNSTSTFSANNSIVKLNIGGTRFTTTRLTLLPCSFFSAAFEHASIMPVAILDEEGAFFLDRSPDLFKHILQFLRTGRLLGLSALQWQEILEEAEFYGLLTLRSYYTQTRREQLLQQDVLNVIMTLWQQLLTNSPFSSIPDDNMKQNKLKTLSLLLDELEKQITDTTVLEHYSLMITNYMLQIKGKTVNNQSVREPNHIETLTIQLIEKSRNYVLQLL